MSDPEIPVALRMMVVAFDRIAGSMETIGLEMKRAEDERERVNDTDRAQRGLSPFDRSK